MVLILPLAVLYTSVITTVCPVERTYNFNEWAFSLNETNNATTTFVTNSVDIQRRASIVYTTFAAIIIICSITQDTGWSEFILRLKWRTVERPPYQLFLTLVAGSIYLADPIKVEKTDAPVLCRGGSGNSEKVFDTTDTATGPLSVGFEPIVISIIAFSALSLLIAAFAWKETNVGKHGLQMLHSTQRTLPQLSSLNRFLPTLVFILVGIFIAIEMNTLRNPGCTTALNGLEKPQTRFAIGLFVYVWILFPFSTQDNDT